MTKQEEMVFAITSQINDLFIEDSEDKRYDWKKLDLTQFFTAYIKAGAYIFNKVTDGDKDFLAFTHLANQLIVQDLMEKEAA